MSIIYFVAIETAKGIPRHIRVNNVALINRIKKSAEDRKGYIYGRTILGFLLQRQLSCHLNGRRVVTEVKDALGEKKFKVSNFCLADHNSPYHSHHYHRHSSYHRHHHFYSTII